MLESFYEVPSGRVAELMRAAIALRTIKTLDSATLLRALEVYEVDHLDFAEAYLVVAQTEATGVEAILSFDKSIDRISTVTRHEPDPTSISTDARTRTYLARDPGACGRQLSCVAARVG